MQNNEAKITEKNWADEKWKKLLIEQRKRLWLPDTVEKFSKWLELEQGMKVVDIGCGLGYLGMTYWIYFGENGSYTGVDISNKLIEEAKELSTEWAINGEALFKVGDAYSLDLQDNSFDLVMCQTLLMHLDEPQKAISEMFRILKPNGTIFCMEPDNYSSSLHRGYSNFHTNSLDEQILLHKINYFRLEGMKKLKQGDCSIGNKLPMLFHNAGFKDIDIRLNDLVWYNVPPYKQDFQQKFVENVRKNVSGESNSDNKYWLNRTKELIIAGGGSKYLVKQYSDYIKKAKKEKKPEKALKMIEENKFINCSSSIFYAAKGIKKK